MLYAEHRGCEPDVRDIMWRIVRAMDAAESGWWADELKRQTAEGGKAGG